VNVRALLQSPSQATRAQTPATPRNSAPTKVESVIVTPCSAVTPSATQRPSVLIAESSAAFGRIKSTDAESLLKVCWRLASPVVVLVLKMAEIEDEDEDEGRARWPAGVSDKR